jgi:hypothetical protein
MKTLNGFQVGRQIFECLGNRVSVFLAFTDKGSALVYGYLTTGKLFNDGHLHPGNLSETEILAVNISKIYNENGFMSGKTM